MTKRNSVGLHILISNDDGITASGLQSLAMACEIAGHRVDVVCPDQERSATSHCLTTQQAIQAKRVDEVFDGHIRAWACSGTPVDAAKLALTTLLSKPPDLVLAGINHGPNLGCDVLYSGTVAAAMEGTLLGIPAMAISSSCSKWDQLGEITPWVLAVVQHFLAKGWPSEVLLNMNLPSCPASEIHGVQWCRPCGRRYMDCFQPQPSTSEEVRYRLGVEMTAEEDPRHHVGPALWPTDLACVQAGWIAITPLQPQMFWHGDPSTLPPLTALPTSSSECVAAARGQ